MSASLINTADMFSNDKQMAVDAAVDLVLTLPREAQSTLTTTNTAHEDLWHTLHRFPVPPSCAWYSFSPLSSSFCNDSYSVSLCRARCS
jgi:hypothetical protein